MNKAVEGLSLDSLKEYARRGVRISLICVGDMASSNVRNFMEIAAQVVKLNCELAAGGAPGRVFFFPVICMSHIIHGNFRKIFSTRELVPKLFHLSFALKFAPRFTALQKALAEIIEEDLSRGGHYYGVEPNVAFRAHTQRIIDLTLRRPLRTHAADDVNAFVETDGETKTEQAVAWKEEKLLTYFSGDISQPRCEYFGWLSVREVSAGPRTGLLDNGL